MGKRFVRSLPKRGTGHQLLVARQAVQIAAERVDFAVVGDHAEGLGQPPAWKRVRAVALVDHRQGRSHVGFGQVGIVIEQLRRQEHALVADRLARQRRDIEGVRRDAQVRSRARRSARFRTRYSRRSNCSSTRPLPPTKTWRITGSALRAMSPRVRLSQGTSRQPSTVSPSASTVLREDFFARAADGRVLRQEEDADAVMARSAAGRTSADRPRRQRTHAESG